MINIKITTLSLIKRIGNFGISFWRFIIHVGVAIVALFTWNKILIDKMKESFEIKDKIKNENKKLLIYENKLWRYQINGNIIFSTYRKENMFKYLFEIENLKKVWIKVKGTAFTNVFTSADYTSQMKNKELYLKINKSSLTNEPKISEVVKKDLNNKVVQVKDLELGFRSPSNPNVFNKVIRKTSFDLGQGEVLGIIGESGSGKSVISSTLYGLTGSTSSISGGQVIVDGTDVTKFTADSWEKSKLRGKVVSAVFQNPMTTLNPTMKIGKQVAEGILINGITKNKKDAYNLALDYLKEMRINDAELVMDMYPHNLSGGMKQRVVLAAIVACQPKIIVFDEPTTALDPTVQAEILEIIKNMVKATGTSAIFITHDLGVVASIANRIAIMYAGQIIEVGTGLEILYNPRHPYTWGLLSSMPDVNLGSRLQTIPGSVPGSLNEITWDAFADRNEYALGIDFSKEPPMFKLSETHYAKTWLLDKRAETVEPPALIAKRWKQFETLSKKKGVK